MQPATPGYPDDAVEVAVPQVPLQRAASFPEGQDDEDGPERILGWRGAAVDAATGVAHVPRARVREAAARNAAGAEAFAAGRYEQAATLFEQVLVSCRAALGDDHPDTLTVAGNLAVAQVAAACSATTSSTWRTRRIRGRGLRAVADCVTARARLFGDTHPATLTARNALAVAHRISGDADSAVPIAKQVVVQRAHALGPAHPDTLTSRMELAVALAATGDVSSAHDFIANAIRDAEETLGGEHEHTVALVECGEAAGLLRREI